jgi:uncharacterized protein YndB with AHSA1/START domain
VGEVRFTTEVSAPLAEVFDAHIDGARIPDWFPGVQTVEDVSGPLDRVGTTYRLRFNHYLTGRCEVVSVDPPHMHARTWDSRPLGSSGRATMRFFEAAPGRTRIDFHATYDLPAGPLGRLVDRLPSVRRRAEQSMRREIDSFADFVQHQGGRAGRPKPVL